MNLLGGAELHNEGLVLATGARPGSTPTAAALAPAQPATSMWIRLGARRSASATSWRIRCSNSPITSIRPAACPVRSRWLRGWMESSSACQKANTDASPRYGVVDLLLARATSARRSSFVTMDRDKAAAQKRTVTVDPRRSMAPLTQIGAAESKGDADPRPKVRAGAAITTAIRTWRSRSRRKCAGRPTCTMHNQWNSGYRRMTADRSCS